MKPGRRTAETGSFPILAETSGDYPVRAVPQGGMQNPYSGTRQDDPADDPSYCCEAHEQLAERLRVFGGASALGANVAKAFDARIRALDAQCPKAVTP